MSDDEGPQPMMVDGEEDQQQEAQPRRKSKSNPRSSDGGDDDAAAAAAAGPSHGMDSDENGSDADNDDSALTQEQREMLADKKHQRTVRKQLQLKKKLQAFNDIVGNEEWQKQGIDPGSRMLSKAGETLETIAKKIKKEDVSNAILDAKAYGQLSILGRRQAQRLTSTVRIDVDDMMKRFVENWSFKPGEGEGIDWTAFGNAITHRFHKVSITSFMKGRLGLQTAVKERKAKERKRRVEDEMNSDEERDMLAQNAAVALKTTDAEEATMTDRRVQALYHHLPAVPSNLFKTLFHPTSFTQTIENIFDLTFLVNKGQAEVTIDPDLQIPMVRRVEEDEDDFVDEASEDEGQQDEEEAHARKKHASKKGKRGRSNFQSIIRLEMSDYDQIVAAFKITRCFLPDRSEQYRANAAAEKRLAIAAAEQAKAAKEKLEQQNTQRNKRASGRSDIGANFSLSQPTIVSSLQSAAKKRKSNQGSAVDASERSTDAAEDEQHAAGGTDGEQEELNSEQPGGED